jgi:hypothetical protein
MSNILQHNIERFGMVTVMDVVLYEVGGTKPILFLDTLKMTNISVEGSNKEIRGGIGNDMLISYDFGRTANIEMQDALISPDSLAFLWGKVKDGEPLNVTNVDYQVVETHKAVDNSGTIEITLDNSDALETTAQLKAYALDVEGTDEGEVEISASGVVTSKAGAGGLTLQEGETYRVFFTARDDSAKEIVLTNDDFPSAVKLIGTTFVINEKDGKKKRVQIEIPKFKIDSNFSFTMDAEGDASVFDFNGVALAQSGELIKFRYLGDY